jgi:hypothetical protein
MQVLKHAKKTGIKINCAANSAVFFIRTTAYKLTLSRVGRTALKGLFSPLFMCVNHNLLAEIATASSTFIRIV